MVVPFPSPFGGHSMVRVKGNDIKDVRTRKSWYDHNCIVLFSNGKDYLLNVDELLRVFPFLEFVEKKARRHTHLKIIGVDLFFPSHNTKVGKKVVHL
jgi:hypothetical protein